MNFIFKFKFFKQIKNFNDIEFKEDFKNNWIHLYKKNFMLNTSFILITNIIEYLMILKSRENSKKFCNQKILIFCILFLMIITTFKSKKIISIIIFLTNLIFALDGYLTYNYINITFKEVDSKPILYFLGAFQYIIHSNLLHSGNFILNLFTMITLSIFYSAIIITKIEIKIFSLLILSTSFLNYYYLECFKRKKYISEKEDINLGLKWRDLLLELYPNTLSVLLNKSIIGNNIIIKNKNEKNLSSKKKSSFSRFQSKMSLDILFNNNKDIHENLGKVDVINSIGKDFYNLYTDEDFYEFIKNIIVTSYEDNERSIQKIINDSLKNLEEKTNNNLIENNKSKYITFFDGKLLFKGKTENVKITICEINWTEIPLLLFMLEKNCLEDEVIKLKELNLYKDQILGSVTHDLRTPLNGINFALDKIKNLINDEEIIKFIIWARANSDLLLNLINDILDYSQIKVGKLRITVSNFNLKKIVDEVVTLMRINASMKHLDLKLSFLIEESLYVINDERRIRQVLINLIGNALKFTNTGYVELKVSEVNYNLLKFEVIDTGIGIKKDRIGKLAQPFVSFDNEEGINKNGIGLFLLFLFFSYILLIKIFLLIGNNYFFKLKDWGLAFAKK